MPAIYEIPEGPPNTEELKTPSLDYDEAFAGTHIPIVIDNGSHKIRAGWASETDPRYVFDNIISKFRNKKVSSGSIVLVGDDVYTDSSARSNIRSAFDSGVPNNPEVMETSLDYVFAMLGCNGSRIDHPVVMTEPLCMPYTVRRSVNELLFEGYSVPAVSYAIDSLCSHYYNIGDSVSSGLVVSNGHSTSHIIPIYNSRPLLAHAKRINIGGSGISDFMLNLLQVKYPSFPVKLTAWQAQYMVRNFTYFSSDYREELRTYLDQAILQDKDRSLQLPFPAPTREERTEEELAQIAERRREQTLKLQELAAKSRMEKMLAREQELVELEALRDAENSYAPAELAAELKRYGLRNLVELDEAIKKSRAVIERARKKSLGEDIEEEKLVPDFSLVDVPDEELDDEGKREKRRQRLLKANYDARERARQLREEEQRKREEDTKRDEEFRLNNFDLWLEQLKDKRQKVIDNINQRHQRRRDLNERKSHAAQARMKNIADLASNDAPAAGAKRRRRGEQEDTFGADDEDWSIYRDISKEEDEEEEEEDRLMLMQYNELLEKYAPDYLAGLDRQACERIQSTLMYRFTEGTQPAILEHPAAPLTKEQVWQREVDIMARRYQLHLNVERIRVPEVLFQPSILGIDQTGVVESICQMIKNIGCCPQDLVKNVFVTGGGFSTIPGLKERLACDLRQALPLQTDVGIRIAKDPFLDAWRGAAKWAAQPAFGDQCVTRDMYLECGSDYLKEHSLGNLFYRPTAPQVVDGVSTLQQKGTKAKRSV